MIFCNVLLVRVIPLSHTSDHYEVSNPIKGVVKKMEKRHEWSSALAYVLTAAGATIGFGATWRFPYLVGENGGGAYVLTFIIAMIVIGIPMILAENVIGRRAHKNSLDAFDPQYQHKSFSKAWKILGYMGLSDALGSLLIIWFLVVGLLLISPTLQRVILIYLQISPQASQKNSMRKILKIILR